MSNDRKSDLSDFPAALSRLARRLDSAASIADLPLPDSAGRRLREVAANLRGQASVARDWESGATASRQAGSAVLLSGPPGSGRAAAAAAFANDLGLPLYRVEADRVTGKYIGETEKNLQAVFDAAEKEGAVLLFDEADALFGKRTGVKDSHDRYANLATGYLLQRIESHPGLVILTSNRKESIDEALGRRLAAVVDFGESED